MANPPSKEDFLASIPDDDEPFYTPEGDFSKPAAAAAPEEGAE